MPVAQVTDVIEEDMGENLITEFGQEKDDSFL